MREIADILERWNGYYKFDGDAVVFPFAKKRCRCFLVALRGVVTHLDTKKALKAHMRHIFGDEPKTNLQEFWKKHGRFLGPPPEEQPKPLPTPPAKSKVAGVAADSKQGANEEKKQRARNDDDSDSDSGSDSDSDGGSDSGSDSESERDSNNKSNSSKSKKQGKEKNKRRYILFFGNMPFDTTAADVEKLLETIHVTPAQVRIPTDKNTQQPQGYAFVEFNDSKDLRKALNLHHAKMGGRLINVELTARGSGNSEARRRAILAKRQRLAEQRARKSEILRQIEAKRSKAAHNSAEREDGVKDSERGSLKRIKQD